MMPILGRAFERAVKQVFESEAELEQALQKQSQESAEDLATLVQATLEPLFQRVSTKPHLWKGNIIIELCVIENHVALTSILAAKRFWNSAHYFISFAGAETKEAVYERLSSVYAELTTALDAIQRGLIQLGK